MTLLDYIPTGRESAIKRADLCRVSGVHSDRKMRDMIAALRRNHIILNTQDGKGYFRPNLPEELPLVVRYKKQEESRLKSIGWALKPVREAVRNAEI